VALNIDRSTHVDGGDHIPYSSDTLDYFQHHLQWAQTQEREFRVFADADEEKRLRFKPMSASQRAFIHSLAEDFGLDSESMDPEPHRHVAIFKTPRFVAPPNKTLAECMRIRKTQRALDAKTAPSSDSEVQKKQRSNEVGDPYNSFVLTSPRFGLTIEEVSAEIASVVAPSPTVQFDVQFLPSEDVVLKALSRTLSETDLEALLKQYKPSLATAIAGKALGKLELCRTDASLNISRRESDSAATDGWSRVAAKGAAPKRLVPQSGLGGTNAFSALSGQKMTFARKKEPKKPVVVEPVVDDWETAEIAEEAKEQSTKPVADGPSDGQVDSEPAFSGPVEDTTESIEHQVPTQGVPLAGSAHVEVVEDTTEAIEVKPTTEPAEDV